ncbi:YobI family P-loop NTPase [Dietzia psychralcaliphila]|uniref:YobI family P-loop NTPase n=1 Tax=Dietzia psychralcaliphila TaxID=139021 RepID=UPI001C1E5F2C|nr:hypothetical protein [Dietzia psychralcaliphila]
MENVQDGKEASLASAPPGSSQPVAASQQAPKELISLSSQFIEEQHRSYLARLDAALTHTENRNIAITGRYGAGKSSVLDKFKASQGSKALRLAISTLSPTDEGETRNNRIQKELVKQLVYSASPRTLQHSRFRRSQPLSWPQSVFEAGVAVGLLGALLALLGWLPTVTGTRPGLHWLVQTVSWVSFAAIFVVVLAVLRRMTHDRFVVSDVSAGGATVKLSERTPTYFDEYLDDIVNYFDTEDVDIVIFEDLDRFDDPHIFEALRELNTLLNNTKKRSNGEPLRFVYAVRDSLFEKLGTRDKDGAGDAAAAENVRANRTKFFDVVIPIVPFISHRNSRELLIDLLTKADITDVDRRLVSLVAAHATDMRLLRNMRNEYLVFAERLMKPGKIAPELTESKLFALVAYKNFHLQDFENIARRTSDLDRLYEFRRRLVRNAVAEQEQRKRDLSTGTERVRTRNSLAEELAVRLHSFTRLYKKHTSYVNHSHVSYRIGEIEYNKEQAATYEFWQAAQHENGLTIFVSPEHAPSSVTKLIGLDRTDLGILIPEAMEVDRWEELDDEATRDAITDIETRIAFLRGADFHDLANVSDYAISVAFTVPVEDNSPEPETIERPSTFGEITREVLKSDLARDLVKSGYIDRNFALYAAQFYGHFTGLDVANFIVQSVQPNSMDLDYPLNRPGAVDNLLAEADYDFADTVAAYNIDVLNHLLSTGDNRVSNIVRHLITDFDTDTDTDSDARTFLKAYLTLGAHRDKFAARLAAQPWRKALVHLVTDENIPEDARPGLVDAALRAINLEHKYELPLEIGEYVAEHYRAMTAFTQVQDQDTALKLVTMLERMDSFIPDIGVLNSGLRELVVTNSRYTVSASNLRAALADGSTETSKEPVDGLELDRVRENEQVYRYCLANPYDYLDAVGQDKSTKYCIIRPDTLTSVLGDVVDNWESGQVARLIELSSPESCLTILYDVSPTVWPALAGAGRIRPSLANIERYRAEIGSIDEKLAKLIENAGAIHMAAPEDTADESGNELDREAAAIAILNSSAIADPAVRVSLVGSLGLQSQLSVADINPEAGELFATLIESRLIADDAASFRHFHEVGWTAMGPAIAASSGISEFLTADLVRGMVVDLLYDPVTGDKIGATVVGAVGEFVPDDDHAALKAVGHFADKYDVPLPPDEILRVAQAGKPNRALVLRLLGKASPPANAQQILGVFAVLGRPYDKFNRSGASFDVEYDSIHEILLTILQDNNICTFKKKRNRDLYTVSVV